MSVLRTSFFLFAIALWSAAGCATSTTPHTPDLTASPTRAQALRGDALRASLSDKTHVGAFAGKPFKAYFAPDGRVRAVVGADTLIGQWSIDTEDTFCIQWSSPPIPRGCSWIVMAFDGLGATYKAEDDTLRNTQSVLEGDLL